MIIGISGKKRSGKDTLAQVIQKHTPEIVRRGFADALKEELAQACGVSTEFIEQHKDKFRTGLQWFGTEFKRQLIQDDYWLRRMDVFLVKSYQAPAVVVPDVRFPNESQYVLDRGGILVRIVRPALFSEDAHPSETALDTFDFGPNVLINDGSLFDFEIKCRNWWEALVAPWKVAAEHLVLV